MSKRSNARDPEVIASIRYGDTLAAKSRSKKDDGP
jgi:hypothetical protein